MLSTQPCMGEDVLPTTYQGQPHLHLLTQEDLRINPNYVPGLLVSGKMIRAELLIVMRNSDNKRSGGLAVRRLSLKTLIS